MSKWQRAMFQPGIGLGENGTRVTESKEHIQLSLDAAKEGMVLLKNDHKLLPFSRGSKLALFGKACIDYVKGGGGSGDVTVSFKTNLVQGFSECNQQVDLFQDTIDFYQKDIDRQYQYHIEPGMTREPELPEELYQRARAYTDTAVICICRYSGEGWDRKSKFDPEEIHLDEVPIISDHMGEKEIIPEKEAFEDGDFYLTAPEKQMVQKVMELFPHIAVVLNVGGMVDTDWFAGEERISSVLLALQGGSKGGSAAAQLLCGIGTPSGKLTDTFAKTLEDYPSSFNFHESEKYVNYTEDIYVGYRFFETIPEAQKRVNYPFGFGLSYTTFSITLDKEEQTGDEVYFSLQVTNTGAYEGKEVVQLYGGATAPLLGKPEKTLLAFQKTRLLKPGETQQIILHADLAQLASYDDLGKIQKSAYILEKGTYFFYAGTSVRDVQRTDTEITLEAHRIIEQLSPKLVPVSLKERMLRDGSMEQLPVSREKDPEATELEKFDIKSLDGKTPSVRALEGNYLWNGDFYKKGVRPLIDVAEGKLSLQDFVAQMTMEELFHLLGGQPNTGVAVTFGIGNMPEYGIPSIMTADGPAGLRILEQCGVCTTAWPCASLLACTWDPEICFAVGEAGAREVRENNIGMWLTPAVNIHRSPLCGRNFEYYSEDPYLAGKMAAAMVEGIQSQHIAVSVKHFALNDKETNRRESDSRVSERAAREIYLKAFEIIVKEAKPWTIMSSYNIINGCRASESKELLTDILRGEWGFDGMVTTDWWCLGEQYKEVKAGNDLKMPLGFPDRLQQAFDKGLISRKEIETCAIHILDLILKMD